MKCPKCGVENRIEAKFCGKCRSKLSRVCPHCKSENPPENTFCDQCGSDFIAPKEFTPIDYAQPQSYTPKHLAEKILTSRSALEGERKVVTVLFADVAGFTALSEKLEPEEVHQIMEGCLQILMEAIHRYEGTINQFTGDGVMALFGAPLAHEDHAQRACHAALATQKDLAEYGEKVKKEYGQEFRMRIGLNSGPVVVGSIGDDLHMDYTAIGDTINLGARVQQAATAGEVWVSQETLGLIRGYFRVEERGEVLLKGKAGPQKLYRVMAERPEVRTRFEAGLTRGVTELVGRRPEMEALRASFERVKGGESQVVDVVGEAGVGKSRLIYEFHNILGQEATFLSGICLQYGKNINFLPVRDVIKEAFNIREGMDEETIKGMIQDQSGAGLLSFLPFYYNLLSLKTKDPKFESLNPEGRKFGSFEAVKSLLLNLSQSRPLVVFLEDVHWMDKISEDFFTYFSRCLHGQAVMMLSAYRPEAAPVWAHGAHYQKLRLETLNPNSSIRLIMNLLGGLELAPALEGKIAERAGGNPFFVEEIMRELQERGDLVQEENRFVCRRPLEQIEIPSTIQGVIAARMDRLSEDLKRTTQVASVIGRDFAYKILKNVMDLGEELRGHLTNLVGIELLYEKTLYPELEYIFKHSLTQDVAYESLLKQRRREIHGRIARAIEELYADKLEQHYEILAHHWELSDTPDRAIEYLILAGEKSNKSEAAASALDFFTRALNLVEKTGKALDSRRMLGLRMERANALRVMGRIEESVSDLKEAIRLGRELDDQQTVLESLSLIPLIIYNTTLKDEIPRVCQEGIELARKLGNKGMEARISALFAFSRHVWGLADGQQIMEEVLAQANSAGDLQTVVFAKICLSVFERWKGNPLRALEHSDGLIDILMSGHVIYAAGSLSFLRGWALTDLGRYQESLSHLLKWIEILEQNSILIYLGRCYNTLGWVYADLYDFEKAIHFNNRSKENAERLRKSPALLFSASEMQAMAEVNLMENGFEMGEIDRTWEHLCRFEESSRGQPYDINRNLWSTRMKDLKASMLLDRRDLDKAQGIAEECLETGTYWKMKKYIGKAERVLGKVMTQRNAFDRSEEHLKTAFQYLDAVGNPKQLWKTRSAIAELYEKMNRPDLAREQWLAAASIIHGTADGLKEEALRKTFIEAVPVQAILKRAKV
jgi:class 3 adenylate cyclase/tetratricopeptide (TPR) repeat protein/ribosomal protein L40E